MRTQLAISFLLALAATVKAQERIDTDRPDQTESVRTVPKKFFQGEFGLAKEDYHHRDFSISYPSFLLKYGLSKRVELRLESDVSTEYFRLIPNDKKITALSPLEIGTKIQLLEEKGALPKTSFIFHLGLPSLGTTDNEGQKLFPSFRFTFENGITENFNIGYNLGGAWDGYSSTPAWLYTFAPGIDLGKKWHAYVEAFGFFPQGEAAQHNLDGGLNYYLGNDAKVDLSGGFGLGHENPLRNYFALGFSFCVPTARHGAAH